MPAFLALVLLPLADGFSEALTGGAESGGVKPAAGEEETGAWVASEGLEAAKARTAGGQEGCLSG